MLGSAQDQKLSRDCLINKIDKLSYYNKRESVLAHMHNQNQPKKHQPGKYSSYHNSAVYNHAAYAGGNIQYNSIND